MARSAYSEIWPITELSWGFNRIKRIRRKLGLRCRQKRKFKVTTDSRHSLPVAENLLDQKFEAAA
ncbi:MAG: hypothetical protein M0Q01_03425, partial [Syntrophales bacterium]|nr:hypothetical protein [Syntrophales bacterium]